MHRDVNKAEPSLHSFLPVSNAQWDLMNGSSCCCLNSILRGGQEEWLAIISESLLPKWHKLSREVWASSNLMFLEFKRKKNELNWNISLWCQILCEKMRPFTCGLDWWEAMHDVVKGAPQLLKSWGPTITDAVSNLSSHDYPSQSTLWWVDVGHM